MATLIIEMSGGLVNELYSTIGEPLNIQIYDLDDRNDPEHVHLFAACSYAQQFGGLTPHFGRAKDHSDRVWASLERRPESDILLSDLCRASTPEGQRQQELDAALLAGYLESLGECKEFLDSLIVEKRVSPEVRRQMVRLIDRQLEKYFCFAEQINTPNGYDNVSQDPGVSTNTLVP